MLSIRGVCHDQSVPLDDVIIFADIFDMVPDENKPQKRTLGMKIAFLTVVSGGGLGSASGWPREAPKCMKSNIPPPPLILLLLLTSIPLIML